MKPFSNILKLLMLKQSLMKTMRNDKKETQLYFNNIYFLYDIKKLSLFPNRLISNKQEHEKTFFIPFGICQQQKMYSKTHISGHVL